MGRRVGSPGKAAKQLQAGRARTLLGTRENEERLPPAACTGPVWSKRETVVVSSVVVSHDVFILKSFLGEGVIGRFHGPVGRGRSEQSHKPCQRDSGREDGARRRFRSLSASPGAEKMRLGQGKRYHSDTRAVSL